MKVLVKILNYIKNRFLYILLILVLSVLVYWLIKNNFFIKEEEVETKPIQSNVELKFKKVKVIGRKEGTAFWTIESEEVDIGKPEQRFVYFRKKPYGSFYNLKDWEKSAENSSTPPEKLRTFTWRADYAEYDTYLKNLTMRGNVKIVTDDKDIIKSDLIKWVNLEEKIFCESKTEIISKSKDLRIIADRVIADVKLEILNLLGNVKIFTKVINTF